MSAGLRRLLEGFWIAPVLAGALLWASFPPLDLGWLQVPGWALLLLSMRLRQGRKAGRQAFVAGAFLFVPGLSWIAPLVFGGWIFTALWSALFEALFAWLLARGWLRTRGWSWVLGAGLVHVLTDALRGFMLSGFPWLLPGYAGWRDPVLREGAALFGVHGATLVFVLLGAALADVAARRLRGEPVRVLAFVPGAAVYAAMAGWMLLAPAPDVRPGPTLALLQGNIQQYNKEQALAAFGSDRASRQKYIDDWRRTYEDLIREAAARGEPIDAFVWPETMVPAAGRKRLERSAATWTYLARLADGASTFAGIMRSDDLGRQWNSVVLVDPSGRAVAAQDKQRLTPGGESIPWLNRLPGGEALEAVFEKAAGYRPLSEGDVSVLLPLEWSGGTARVGVLICIESIFSQPSREMVNSGADLLLNASNYGWFAGTAEMEQALAMSSFRAAELGVPVVTASNNGVSAVIDATGVPLNRLTDDAGRSVDVPGVLVAEVPLGGRTTPFRAWGEWPAWIFSVLGAILGSVIGRRSLPT